MLTSRRSALLATGALLALAACGSGNTAQPKGKYETASDMAIGDPKAPVTLIEYASLTCPHCRTFHESVLEKLKANYIDTGKVRFVFREFTTPPAELAAAGFQIARCGDADAERYFSRLAVMFDKQPQIFAALQAGQARQALLEIAQSAGLSEAQFDQCVSDEKGFARIKATEEAGVKEFKITGTPSLILNGERLTAPAAYTYEGLAELIDAEIAKS